MTYETEMWFDIPDYENNSVISLCCTFLVDTDEFYDSDIGGVDGVEISSVTLRRVFLGPSSFDRDMAIGYFGLDQVHAWEDEMFYEERSKMENYYD